MSHRIVSKHRSSLLLATALMFAHCGCDFGSDLRDCDVYTIEEYDREPSVDAGIAFNYGFDAVINLDYCDKYRIALALVSGGEGTLSWIGYRTVDSTIVLLDYAHRLMYECRCTTADVVVRVDESAGTATYDMVEMSKSDSSFVQLSVNENGKYYEILDAPDR